MSDFPIPHIAPVRFVKSLISADFNSALVNIGFDYIPSLAMLIEAATQSSSGVLDDDKDISNSLGFLVTVKNVKLLQKLKSKEFIVNVILDNKLANFKYFSFSIIENDVTVAIGTFSISLQ